MTTKDERWKIKKFFLNWEKYRSEEWWQSVKIAAIRSKLSIGEWIVQAIDEKLDRKGE